MGKKVAHSHSLNNYMYWKALLLVHKISFSNPVVKKLLWKSDEIGGGLRQMCKGAEGFVCDKDR